MESNTILILLLIISATAFAILIIGAFYVYKLVGNVRILESLLRGISKEPTHMGISTGANSETYHLQKVDDVRRQWLKKIDQIEKNELKLEYLEAAAKRFPADKEIIKQIRDILFPLAGKESADNILVRREALMRLREHVNNFSDHCGIDDLSYAHDLKKEVVASMEDVVATIDQNRRNSINRLLQEMGEDIKKLHIKPSDSELLNKIEKKDERIDKSLLRNYPEMQKRYTELSNELMQILGAGEIESKTGIRKRNEKALEDGKAALVILESSYKKGFKEYLSGTSKHIDTGTLDLGKIARLLGRHDYSKLLPSTVNYLRTAESEIFAKLSPEDKIKFTELMIQESSK